MIVKAVRGVDDATMAMIEHFFFVEYPNNQLNAQLAPSFQLQLLLQLIH